MGGKMTRVWLGVAWIGDGARSWLRAPGLGISLGFALALTGLLSLWAPPVGEHGMFLWSAIVAIDGFSLGFLLLLWMLGPANPRLDNPGFLDPAAAYLLRGFGALSACLSTLALLVAAQAGIAAISGQIRAYDPLRQEFRSLAPGYIRLALGLAATGLALLPWSLLLRTLLPRSIAVVALVALVAAGSLVAAAREDLAGHRLLLGFLPHIHVFQPGKALGPASPVPWLYALAHGGMVAAAGAALVASGRRRVWVDPQRAEL